MWASQMGMSTDELLEEETVSDFMLQKKFFEDELERRKSLGDKMAHILEQRGHLLEEKEIQREEHLVASKVGSFNWI